MVLFFKTRRDYKQKIGSYDVQFAERLERVQEIKPHFFEPGIDIADDAYGLRRSLRRGWFYNRSSKFEDW